MTGADRGGLNYRIDVKDGFSKSLKRFRTEVRGAKKDFEALQKARSRRASGPSAAKPAKAATKNKRLLTEQRNEARRREKEEQAALATRARNFSKAQKVRDAASARGVKREKDRISVIKKRELAEKRARRELDKAAAAAARLDRNLKRTSKTTSGLVFKFRRLVGTLAVFTIARKAVQGFNTLVASGLRFTDTVQASTLGVAGLINTLSQVRDEQGNLVTGAEAFNVAIGISRKQINALRVDSLRTVATFEQLLDTFQVAVGPGLAAGLGLDEIRTLSVQISQAATALSVPQNQLAEEIRSLLAGTIQARTTRIATALGITNKDIKEMKAAGTLFESLTASLAGFSEAAETAAKSTLSGISTLLTGALQETLGSASEGLRDNLLGTLNEIFEVMLQIDETTGDIVLDPRLVSSFAQIFDALSRGVDAAKDFGEQLGFEGLNEIAADLAGLIDVITAIGSGLGSAFGILVESLKIAKTTVEEIVESVGGAEISFGELGGLVSDLFVAGLQDALDIIRLIAIEFELLKLDPEAAAANIASGAEKAFLSIASIFSDEAGKTLIRKFEEDGLIDTDSGEFRERSESPAVRQAREQREEILNRIAGRRQDIDARAASRAARATGTGDTPDDGPDDPGGSAFTPSIGTQAVEDRIIKLKEEMTLLREKAEFNKFINSEELQGIGNAQRDLAIARARVDLAEAEFAAKRQALNTERTRLGIELVSAIQAERRSGEVDEQGRANGALSSQLMEQLALLREKGTIEARTLLDMVKQTKELERQAELVANGSVGDGFEAGLLQFGKEFSSEFNAGLEIATTALNGFVDFASSAIVDAFDPTKDVDIVERFARLMQEIAQVILAELIQLAISKAILENVTGGGDGQDDSSVSGATTVGAIKVATEVQIAAIRLTNAAAIAALNTATGGVGGPLAAVVAAEGGLIPHFGPRAQGLARGGFPKPSGIPASDTVPAWLTPGEFVMRKSAVDSIGITTLAAMNGGNFGVTGSSDAAGSTTGMASGGSVAESVMAREGASSNAPTILPVQVAGEKELDQLTNGGKRAMLEFLRENSDTITGFQRG